MKIIYVKNITVFLPQFDSNCTGYDAMYDSYADMFIHSCECNTKLVLLTKTTGKILYSFMLTVFLRL